MVADQTGRLTFTSELAGATRHLLESAAPYGTYNVTNAGPPMSWYDVARSIWELTGRDPSAVSATTTAAYGEGKQLAPRPAHSYLPTAKLETTGWTPTDAVDALQAYLDPASEVELVETSLEGQ